MIRRSDEIRNLKEELKKKCNKGGQQATHIQRRNKIKKVNSNGSRKDI